MRIGLSLKGPIPVASKIGGPLTGLHDAGHIIAAAGFQQQHADTSVFRQATGDYRSG